LEPLTADETDLLAERTQERVFGRGETVYAPGHASEVVFVLLRGVSICMGWRWRHEHTFDVLREGTVFGIASLMKRNLDE
jgi:signal-transduction protein with cAMP-binding, CBS, and nucleotidyltransferase domain